MKTTFNYIYSLIALSLMMTACEDDFKHPSEGGIPLAANINCEIIVDQEENEVTFNLKNPGCNPVWIFSEKELSTVNGLKKVFAGAGTYTVEVKISNANGISDGSVTHEFTLNNSRVDFSRYYSIFSGGENKSWMIAKDESGHLGCGSSGSDGLEWWSAQPGDKADFGVYDDIMNFSIDEKYTYNPGEGGTVFVNKDCSIFPEYNTSGEDFMANVEEYETDYGFVVKGADVYLSLPAKSYLAYIPNDEIYNEPLFKIVSFSNTKIELIADNGAIAWKMVLVPLTKEETPEDKLAGTWYWAKNNMGHLSCGPTGTNGTEWWQAQAGEKEDFGIYNHSLTFSANGEYSFNPGETGTFFVNKDCSIYPEYNTNGEDFNVPTDIQNSTWKFVYEGADTYIEFPAHTIVGYVPNDAAWETPKFKVITQTESDLHILYDNGDIVWQMQFVKEVTEIDKDEPVIYDPDSENNLWNNCNYVNHYYYAPEWVEIAAPEMTVNGNSYSFALPSATYNQWQAQAHFKTDIKTNASTNYDFCVVINSSKDFNGVTVKLALDGDDDTFYFIEKVAVKAYEDMFSCRKTHK